MADRRIWPALVVRADRVLAPAEEDALSALLDDFAPVAVQDLAELPLPPGGLWDPTYPPPPEPPPSPLQWRVFFATGAERVAAQEALRRAFPRLALAPEEIADEDWAARSQQSLTAVHAGRFIVAPPWDLPPETDATVIVIEPSRGFGTGHHASTRLCLRAMSALDLRGVRVLDLGTGSGVLAMAAALSGAREVTAVDVDLDAIESARESATLNPLPIAIAFEVADFRDEGTSHAAGLAMAGYDVVLANLTGGMLTSAAPRIRSFLNPDGVLVTSGFDESEREGVAHAFGPLIPEATMVEDDWVAIRFRS